MVLMARKAGLVRRRISAVDNSNASSRSGAASSSAVVPSSGTEEERAGRSRKRLRSRGGFTLIESLVALAILGVIVAVLVNVHLQTLRAEEFSRLRDGAVLKSETILTGSMLGKDVPDLVDDAHQAGWRVTAERAETEAGAPAFTEWRVADSNPSAPAVSMMLRMAERGTNAGQTEKTSRPAP